MESFDTYSKKGMKGIKCVWALLRFKAAEAFTCSHKSEYSQYGNKYRINDSNNNFHANFNLMFMLMLIVIELMYIRIDR